MAIEAFCQRKTGICLTHRVIALAIQTGDMSLQANFMSRLTYLSASKARKRSCTGGVQVRQVSVLADWPSSAVGRLRFGEEIQAAVGDATAGPNFPASKPSVLWPMRPNQSCFSEAANHLADKCGARRSGFASNDGRVAGAVIAAG